MGREPVCGAGRRPAIRKACACSDNRPGGRFQELGATRGILLKVHWAVCRGCGRVGRSQPDRDRSPRGSRERAAHCPGSWPVHCRLAVCLSPSRHQPPGTLRRRPRSRLCSGLQPPHPLEALVRSMREAPVMADCHACSLCSMDSGRASAASILAMARPSSSAARRMRRSCSARTASGQGAQ